MKEQTQVAAYATRVLLYLYAFFPRQVSLVYYSCVHGNQVTDMTSNLDEDLQNKLTQFRHKACDDTSCLVFKDICTWITSTGVHETRNIQLKFLKCTTCKKLHLKLHFYLVLFSYFIFSAVDSRFYFLNRLFLYSIMKAVLKKIAVMF